MTRLASCCLTLAILAAGCSDQAATPTPDPASNGITATDGTAPSQLAFGTGTGSDAGSRLPGDQLALGTVRPATIDPATVPLADQGAVIVTDLLYDGLTEAVGITGQLRGALATDWVTADDGLSWTFDLDTARVSPTTVVDHFDRLLTSGGGATTTALLDAVTGVEAVGADQVRFDLDRPEAALPWLLSGVALSVTGPGGAPTGHHDIAPPPDPSSPDPAANQVGAVLGLSDQVRLASTDPARPDVILHWFDTPRDAYDALTLGQVDAAVAPPDAMGDAASRFGEIPHARSITRFYLVNTETGTLTDPDLRSAVLNGLDRAEIADDTFGAPVFVSDSVLAPTLAGYHRGGCTKDCRYDPTGAADTVAAATATLGSAPTLTIAITGDEQLATAQRIAADLTTIGFAVTINQLDPAGLVTAIQTGSADLYSFGTVAPSGSIDAVVPQLFASDSTANVAGIRSSRIDELIERAATTIDDDARWALLNEANDLALAEQRILPLAVAKSNLVAAPHASTIVTRADGSLDLGGK